MNLHPKYKLKCDINTYVGPNYKLLHYHIGSKDKLNNFIFNVEFRILDELNNDVFRCKVNFRLQQNFFEDSVQIISSNNIRCFCIYLIEKIEEDLKIKNKKCKHYNFNKDEHKKWSIRLNDDISIQYEKQTGSLIIILTNNEHFLDYRNMNYYMISSNLSKREKKYINSNSFLPKTTKIKFKLNNESKKQFIQELKNTVGILKQIVWKFVSHRELNHYINKYLCKTCERWNGLPVDKNFIIQEYF